MINDSVGIAIGYCMSHANGDQSTQRPTLMQVDRACLTAWTLWIYDT